MNRMGHGRTDRTAGRAPGWRRWAVLAALLGVPCGAACEAAWAEEPASAPAAGAGEPSVAAVPTVLPTTVAEVAKPAQSPEAWWNEALGLGRPALHGAPRAPVKVWSGDLTLRARGRYTGSVDDTDLYQHLRLRYRREDAPGLSASLHLRVSEDLDGLDDSSSFFVFDSVDDAYDSAVVARLYHAYANWRPPGCGVLEQVRVGRQYVTAGDLFQVDGLHVTLAPQGQTAATRFTLFGGVPTHLFDSSLRGDFLVGAGVSFRPWRGASVELSDVYLEDESDLYGGERANLAVLEASQRLSSWGALRVGYQHLDEEPRRASAALDVTLERWSAMVRAAFSTQILRERELVYDLDPYFAIALDLAPYWDGRLSASKALTRCLTVEGGVQARALYDQSDEGTFNREFVRTFASLATLGWPWHGVALAAVAEWWSAEDREDVLAAGFEIDWKRSARWRWTAGVDYSLYHTDLYAAAERYDNYGWYLRLRHAPSARWSLDGSLRLDDDDFDTYVTAVLAVRFEF